MKDPVRCAVFRRRNDAQEPRHLAQVERGQWQQPPRCPVSHSQTRRRASRQRRLKVLNIFGLRNFFAGIGTLVQYGTYEKD